MDIGNRENGQGSVKQTNITPVAQKTSQIEAMKTEINYVLLGQQMTCEILTNLCCVSEQDNEDDDWDDSDSDDMNSSAMMVGNIMCIVCARKSNTRVFYIVPSLYT